MNEELTMKSLQKSLDEISNMSNMSNSELSERAKKARLKDTEFTEEGMKQFMKGKIDENCNAIEISDDGKTSLIHIDREEGKEKKGVSLEEAAFAVNYIREHGREAFEKWLYEA